MHKQLFFISIYMLVVLLSCSLPHIHKTSFYYEPDIPADDNKIIPLNRRIDWYPGIPGDIPDYPDAINAKDSPYNAAGDDTTDDTAAIQAAINACPPGSAVYLPAGTYRISNQLTISRSIVLRGAGPENTRIKQYSTARILQLYSGNQRIGPIVKIISGFYRDSTSITVSNAATFESGDYIVMYQDNLDGLVFKEGSGGRPCEWCGIGESEGNHAMTQIVRIESKLGNSLKINRPLYFGFTAENNPEIQEIGMISGVGVEDLAIEQAVSGGSYNIFASSLAYSWLKNIHSYMCPSAHLRLMYSYGCEIRDSYFYDAYTHTGSASYGIFIIYPNSDHLIENNKILKCSPSICHEGGGSGNVIAYNYARESFHEDPSEWFFKNIVNHGAHPYMNLFEGNYVDGIALDNYWGSSSHNTYFRNYVTRHRTTPEATEGIYAVEIGTLNYYNSFVGNVFCQPDAIGTVNMCKCSDNRIIWRMGCFSGASTGNPEDPFVSLTTFRHGNYNYITNSVNWDIRTSEKIIPHSLYLTSKPSFFGSLSWPPFGPDVSGKVGEIPAAHIAE
ncbi:MAG: hypothetical protein JW881_03205 [Spirochaetales bacterium]|nr:hypothetical protein [Spirochaetales bacterium]